jgi:hypothetical protein
MIAPVTTMQIYWGAPFLCIQILMVALMIAFPGIVSSGLDKAEVYDLDKVRPKWKPTCQHPWSRLIPRLACPDQRPQQPKMIL